MAELDSFFHAVFPGVEDCREMVSRDFGLFTSEKGAPFLRLPELTPCDRMGNGEMGR